MSKDFDSKQNYHHGDLRQTALNIGLQMLKEDEHVNLSLRDIARRSKVSATALYRHFPNKDALLTALAKEGMDRLGHVQHEAAKNAGGGANGFAAMGVAYIDFAISNTALFRLTFKQAPNTNLLNAELDEVNSAMRGLRENIMALMPKDWPDVYRTTAALRAWSLVHGLAVLILDKQIEYDPKLVEQVVTDTNIISDSHHAK